MREPIEFPFIAVQLSSFSTRARNASLLNLAYVHADKLTMVAARTSGSTLVSDLSPKPEPALSEATSLPLICTLTFPFTST